MATDATGIARTTARQASPSAAARALRSLGLPILLIFWGTLAVYWSTRTEANTFDAVSYANQIAHLYPRTGQIRWMFHPHHLLFNALGYVLWRAAHLLGYRGGSLAVLQSLNAVLGAGGVAVFYFTLRFLLQRSRWLPLLISLGLAFSFGFWICATDGRVNMPSVFLMLCAFALLCRAMQQPSLRLAAGIGVLAGAAVLFHESAALFVAVSLTGILLAEADPLMLPAAARLRHRRETAAFLGAWAATIGLPYLIVGVFALHLHSVASFRHWSNQYAELGWWWDFHIGTNLGLDARAFLHAVLAFLPGQKGLIHLGLSVSPLIRALYFAALIGAAGAVYAFLAALPLLWRSHNRRLLILCGVWILVYAAFFTVWSPGYFVFWVPVLLPASVLLALALSHYRAGRGGLAVNWLVGSWITAYALLNLHAGMMPHLQANSDPFRRIAADVRAHTRPGDVVVVAGAGSGGPCEVALPYFADRDVISLHGLLTHSRNDTAAALFGPQGAQAQIAGTLAAGRAVYALDEVMPGHDPRTLAALAARHSVRQADLKALLSPFAVTHAWQSPRGPVWRLTPRPVAPLIAAPRI